MDRKNFNLIDYPNIKTAIEDNNYLEIMHTLDNTKFTHGQINMLDKYVNEYINHVQRDTYFSLKGNFISIDNEYTITHNTVLLIDSWFKFCYEKWVSPFAFLARYFTKLFNNGIYNNDFLFQMNQYAQKNSLKKYQATQKDAEEYLNVLVQSCFMTINGLTNSVSHLSDDFRINTFENILNNSQKIANECIDNEINRIKNILPTMIFKRHTDDNIKDAKYELDCTIKNMAKTFKRTYNKKNYLPKNHILAKIFTDEIQVTDNYTPILKNFTNGLALGYATQSILSISNKKFAISKIEKHIKDIEGIGVQHNNEQINSLKETIRLLKTNERNIPIKSIASIFNMSESEAISLARSIFGSNQVSVPTYKQQYKNWIDTSVF